jgi:hypothetical protein
MASEATGERNFYVTNETAIYLITGGDPLANKNSHKNPAEPTCRIFSNKFCVSCLLFQIPIRDLVYIYGKVVGVG